MYFKEAIAFLGVITVVSLSAILLAIGFDKMSCQEKWADYGPVYSYPAGCQIPVDGKMTPTTNLRFI